MADFRYRQKDEEPKGGIYKDYPLEEVNEAEDLVLEFVVSTQGVDREGDTINPDGWKLDNFNKNPVILFAHDYQSPPVAKAIATWVEDGKLISRARFTPKEVYPFGYMIYQMYKNGFMKATSVGFTPITWEYSDERKGGVNFLEQELLEWSCVPVPANPEALIAAGEKGIDIEPLKDWAKAILKGIDKTIKGVISYNDAHPNGTPKADEDTEWDGNAEVAAADVEDLQVMCAWVDDENPDIKGSYKLPHHQASGQHAVVWRGVSAAMGALLGARGGVDIPEADRRGVYNHLAQHYQEFDKEPPEFQEAEKGQQPPTPTDNIKTGAVLSKANKDKLIQAQQLIQEVLNSAEPESEESAQPAEAKSEITIDEVKAMIKTSLHTALDQLRGKLD